MSEEISMWYLKDDKESISILEDIINRAGSWVFNIFIEDAQDVEFKGIKWDDLVSVYIKWRFNRFITKEQREEISEYQNNATAKSVVVAEIQPKAFDSEVMVVKVKRWDFWE